jgi:hypothetical protein
MQNLVSCSRTANSFNLNSLMCAIFVHIVDCCLKVLTVKHPCRWHVCGGCLMHFGVSLIGY